MTLTITAITVTARPNVTSDDKDVIEIAKAVVRRFHERDLA